MRITVEAEHHNEDVLNRLKWKVDDFLAKYTDPEEDEFSYFWWDTDLEEGE